MLDKENYYQTPTDLDFEEYIHNDTYLQLKQILENKFGLKSVFEFSKCSFEFGWNIKFKKSRKNICTLYPKQDYFTLLVVISRKDKPKVEAIFESLGSTMQQIILDTKEVNDSRWLMIDIEDFDQRFIDTLKLIEIKLNKAS